jgi:hypothetical protein
MDDKDTVLSSSADTININVDDLLTGDMYLDTSNMSAYNFTYSNIPSNITISGSSSSYGTTGAVGSAGSFLTSNGANGTSWSTLSATSITNPPSLDVTGDANFQGDVKIKGVSIAKSLEDIQKRLAILVPDPAKLEHFEALKKAYDHYKTLEALCEIPKEDKE